MIASDGGRRAAGPFRSAKNTRPIPTARRHRDEACEVYRGLEPLLLRIPMLGMAWLHALDFCAAVSSEVKKDTGPSCCGKFRFSVWGRSLLPVRNVMLTSMKSHERMCATFLPSGVTTGTRMEL